MCQHKLANALEEQQAVLLVDGVGEEGRLGLVLCVLIEGHLVQSRIHSGDLAQVPQGLGTTVQPTQKKDTKQPLQ